MFMGGLLLLVGLLLYFADRIPGLGKLPGDFIIRRKNFTFYAPLTTSLLISLILSLLFYLIQRFR